MGTKRHRPKKSFPPQGVAPEPPDVQSLGQSANRDEPSGQDQQGRHQTVHLVMTAISRETLARLIYGPVDAACESYQADEIVPRSYQEFIRAVTSFGAHLLRHGQPTVASGSPSIEAEEALALVCRAFARDGEANGAWAEARDGFRGGIRYVFSRIAEHLKLERASKYKTRVLKEAMDPLDYPAKRELGQALLERLAPLLPADLRNLRPEQVALHWEAICEAYMHEHDKIMAFLKQ